MKPLLIVLVVLTLLASGITNISSAANDNFKAPLVPPDLQYDHDVEIGMGGTRTLKMEICYPKTAPPEPWPVLIYIHGGGWNHGSKNEHANKIVGYAKRGYVGVAIEYRLTGEATFPAQIEDCKLAVRYLRAHAEKYYLDPDRIGVWGTSAGAHLASLLGTLPSGTFEGTGGWANYSSRVQAVVDWFGPADFISDLKQADRFSSLVALLGKRPSADPEWAKKAMPGTYASSDDPPFLIMHGTKDTTVPITQSQTFYQSLIEAGVDATFIPVEGAGHGFSDYPEASQLAWEFLATHLKK